MWKLPHELAITNHKRADRYLLKLTKTEMEIILREVEESGNCKKCEEPVGKEPKERN